LATILFSSFVPVKDMNALPEFLAQKNKQYSNKDHESINDADNESEIINNGIDSAFYESTLQEKKNEPIQEENKDNLVSLDSYREKQEKTDKVEKKGFVGSVINLIKGVENNFPNDQKNIEQPLVIESEPAPQNITEQLETKEEIENRNKNKARREKQKAKKRQSKTQSNELSETDNSQKNELIQQNENMPIDTFEKTLMIAGALTVADVMLDENTGKEENTEIESPGAIVSEPENNAISEINLPEEIKQESVIESDHFPEINTNVELDDFSTLALASDHDTLKLLDLDDDE
jgi:hypothetical protein